MRLRKVYYTIGNIGRFLSLRFSITLKNNKGDFCVASGFEGEYLQIKNLYPTLTLTVMDEVKDYDNRRWSPEKSVGFSRFTGVNFVTRSRKLIEDFVAYDNLFQYVQGRLTVDQNIAKSISFVTSAEFDRKLMVMPVVGKDPQYNELYEGVIIMIGNVSNNVTLTYDEFVSLVEYMDRLDYDGLAIKLLNTALSIDDVKAIQDGNSTQSTSSPEKVDWVDKPNTIPKL